MTDLIRPLSLNKIPHHVEVRADQVIGKNNLDANGNPGDPGKDTIIIDTIEEVQDVDNNMISRTRGKTVTFDPMLYKDVVIPGTGMTVGQIAWAYKQAIDHFKGGLPNVSTP
jgi:hypothetical protein